MHIPLTPPDFGKTLSSLTPEQMSAFFTDENLQQDEHYWHWDDLRHRTPSGSWLVEHWWARIKLGRLSQMKSLPLLLDKQGKPFSIAVPEIVQRDLHHIDRDTGGLIGTNDIMSSNHRDRYLMHSLIEEAITSSQLEGASTTRRIAEQMLREGRRPKDHSERMIFNNFKAMETIRTFRHEAITPNRILELHKIVTEHTLENPTEAGRLRQDNQIAVRDRTDGTLLHQPPDYGELPQRLDRLCQFANQTENDTPYIHPVLRAIILHFMIGYDHPFADGNGRTARALFYWSMAKQGYWLAEFISISHFLRKAPSQYVRAYLQTETDDRDITYFARHQLKTIRQATQALHTYLDDAIQSQKETEKLLARNANKLREQLNHRQITLLTSALRNPEHTYRMDTHQRTHGIVYETARHDLLQLEALGLLLKYKQGKAYVFSAPADLRQKLDRLAPP